MVRHQCNHTYLFFLSGLVAVAVRANASNTYCREILQDQNVQQINWSYLKDCLHTAFDGIDSIPPLAYKYMGYSLTSIPLEDLRNITMENVDVVEIFGSIRSTTISGETLEGFNADHLSLIAQNVRLEWSGKNPQTYSEYDLRVMGEILCYLNVSDIANIHTDAFKEAAEWIGLIEKCPQDRLEALANLARRSDAFGEPRMWSKLEVSIIGNILNGLTSSEINAIAKDKLQLNHFYKSKQQPVNKSHFNTTKMTTTTITNFENISPSTRTKEDMANKSQNFDLS